MPGHVLVRQLVARLFLFPSVLVGGVMDSFWLEPFPLHGSLFTICADQSLTSHGYTLTVVTYSHAPILASTSIHGMAGMQVAPDRL